MTKIIQRHDTAANWTTINPILASGEMGVETDTNKFKFGNGTSTWSELAYATSGSSGGDSGTQLTSADGDTSYSTLALGDNLVVDTGDIAWTNPAMTSNSQNGYIASASSTYDSDGAEIWKAFDKDTTTSENAWYTGQVSMPQWIMLECPEPVRLTSCMIENEVSTPVNFRSGYIQGSNDGNTFDTLYTITDRPNTYGLKVTYSIDTTKYYKYLRVYCTAQWSSPYGNGLSIQEIEFKGFVKDASAVPSLNVNLDELGNEVNTLTSAVSTIEGTVSELSTKVDNKQDVLTSTDTVSITQESIGFDLIQTGSGIVKNEDGSYSSALTTGAITNYLMVSPKLDFFYSNDWELILPFKADNLSHFLSLFSTKNNDGPSCAYEGNLRVWYGPNRPSYPDGFSVTAGTKTWLKCKYINSTFTVYKSTDGINYTKQYSYNPGGTPNSDLSKDLYFFGAPNSVVDWISDNYAFTGTIYLNEIKIYKEGKLIINRLPNTIIRNNISANPATTTSLGVVKPDGTTITVNDAGVISGQDVKTFSGYSDTGTLILKSINGVLQWVAE